MVRRVPEAGPNAPNNSMDCRTFQNLHVAFVDDVLPAFQMDGMRRHIRECAACSRHDSNERRALMVVRSLPRIEPSPDFGIRLDARLRESRNAVLTSSLSPARMTAVAASLAMLLAVGAVVASSLVTPSAMLMHQPVVAVIPEPETRVFTNGALVASVSTGMPMLPVALIAEEAPVLFANSEFRLASFSR